MGDVSTDSRELRAKRAQLAIAWLTLAVGAVAQVFLLRQLILLSMSVGWVGRVEDKPALTAVTIALAVTGIALVADAVWAGMQRRWVLMSLSVLVGSFSMLVLIGAG
ncbi:hypothetical protein [Nocardioides sp.]|uniref:hypothetical protein n=1 Tax=Nocardioides sp. TaxID=35761 RepID=UPI0039E3051A